MLLKRLAFLFCIFLTAFTAYAQQPPTTVTRDAQAVSVLAQCLNAVGGLATISAVQDYTGTGNITYNWAGQEVQGSVTVRGMGTGNFRLDANLPQGVRTWSASGYSGVLIHEDGTRESTAFYNLTTAGSMTFPYTRIAAALNDATTSIAYVGTSAVSNPATYQIHVAVSNAANIAGSTSLQGLGSFDVFIDSTSLLVTKLSDQVRSESNAAVVLIHEIEFQNYQSVGNIKFPMTIHETVNGQLAASILLNAITLNSGLTQADFTP